jgi:hypothetical protein
MGHRGRDRFGWRTWRHCAATDLTSFTPLNARVSVRHIHSERVGVSVDRPADGVHRRGMAATSVGPAVPWYRAARRVHHVLHIRVETQRLIQVGDPPVAIAYFGGPVIGALLAVQVGVLLARFPRAFLHRRAKR